MFRGKNTRDRSASAHRWGWRCEVADRSPHRVVIRGGGFGGLFAAKFLRRVPADIALIDRTNHHTFQPLLGAFELAEMEEDPLAWESISRHE